MNKKIIFGLTPLLVLALASCVMYNGNGKPGGKKSSESAPVSEPSSPESQPDPMSSNGSSGGGESQPGGDSSSSSGGEVDPIGQEVKVYLVFGENGKYQGSAVDSSIDALFLEHTIEMTMKAGENLPASPAVSSSVSGSTFVGWVSYDNGVLTTYTKVPAEDGKILYASFSGGNGQGGSQGQGGQDQGGGGQGQGQGGGEQVVTPTSYICSSAENIAFSGYGLKFSDNTYMAGVHVGTDNGFDQYLISNRGFKKDQVFRLIDFSNGATWAVAIDTWSFGAQGTDSWQTYLEFNETNRTYKALKDFNIESIYIKLKENQDQIYFQLAADQDISHQVAGAPGQGTVDWENEQGQGQGEGGGEQVDDGLPKSGYGIKIGDKTYVIAEHVGEDNGFDQYFIASYEFKKYQAFQLINYESRDTWAVPVDGYSFGGQGDETWKSYLQYDADAGNYTVLKDFNSNGIYIKLKYQEDNVYIGLSDEQPESGDEGGGDPDPLPVNEGYGIKFNDGTYLVAESKGNNEGFDEYYIGTNEFKKDQTFQLIDFGTNIKWAVPVDGYSFGGQGDETWKAYLELDGDSNVYKVLQDFEIDGLYIKLKYGEDHIYFGLKADEGGEGGEGGEGDELPDSGYGIIFRDDESYALATYVGEEDGFKQYKIENLSFKAEQKFNFVDFSTKIGWYVDLDPYSFGGDGNTEDPKWGEYMYVDILMGCYVVIQDFTAKDIYIKLKYEEDTAYFALADEAGEDPQEHTAPFYLVGELTDWGYDENLAFAEKNEELPENAEKQWYFKGEFAAGKEFKIRSGDGNTWLSAANIEDGSKALVTGEDNFSFVEAGEYEIYLKLLKDNGGYSIYIAKVVGDQGQGQGGEGGEQQGGEQEPTEGYGFKFSDDTFVAAVHVDDFDGYSQYKIEGHEFKKDQVFQLINFGTGDKWAIPVDGYSFGGDSAQAENWKSYLSYDSENQTYTALQDFKCDIYIKLKYLQDQIYIGLVA